jgi:hypothetical protein
MGEGNENLACPSPKDFKRSFTCCKVLRHGTFRVREEGVLRIFIALKNTSSCPGSKPQSLGPVASTLTTTRLRWPNDRRRLQPIVQSRPMWQIYNFLFRVVFWDILPCKIIADRRFRGACCFHHQGLVSLARKDRGYIGVQGPGGQSWWETIG